MNSDNGSREMEKEAGIEELQEKIKELEENQEEFEYNAKQVLQDEEEEDIGISQSHAMLEKIREKCSPEDIAIQQIIDEKQDMLRGLRKKKIEFDDEFRREIKKQRQKKEIGIEELYQQISDMKYKEDK